MQGETTGNVPLDKRKLEVLFHRHFPALVSFARKILMDEDSAREVVHNVFIGLWERRSEIDTSKPLKSYLFTAVRHRCLNEIRNRKKTDLRSEPEFPEEENAFSDHLETVELEQKILAAIESLAPQSRTIFEMNRFEGFTYREIAEKLKISQKTVETLMSRTLKNLRNQLKDYLPLLIWIMIHTLWLK